MPRFFITVFGCQMNKLDGELLEGLFVERGWDAAESARDADVVVFLGCSVRQHAEDRLLSRVGRLKFLKRKRPQMVVAVGGCIAQVRREEILKRLPFVDLVVGPGSLLRLPELSEALLAGAKRPVCCYERLDKEFDGHRRPKGGLSAFLRVMRGCSRACAYCVVPRARGPAVSRPPDAILSEAQKLADAGVKEIVLIGQDVSAYRFGDVDFPRLLQLVAQIEGPKRFGFVTSHPLSVSTRLFEVMADNPRISRYLHMPAQSGSDRILRLMRRGYSANHYIQTVQTARSIVGDLEVASDFIVGFPTETEEDFAATLKLLHHCAFINSFIFKYSPRPYTLAAKMEDDVPSSVKKERNLRLLEAQSEVSLQRKKSLLGKTVAVLVEGRDKKSQRLRGRTFNNHIVVFDGSATVGDVVSVKIETVTPLTAFGKVEEDVR